MVNVNVRQDIEGWHERFVEALQRWPAIQHFLGQDVRESADVPASRDALARLLDDAAGQPFPLNPTHGT